jgi:uncharacterized phage-like protein YoqJ
MAAKEKDFMAEYMKTAQGTPEPIVQGVLLFFKSRFSNEELDSIRTDISQQKDYSLENTHKILEKYDVEDETARQIVVLLNKKFKEAIEKKAMTSKKLDFIRSVKKKH